MMTVLITGASSGIGAGLAKSWANDGWHVIACGRDPARLEALHQHNPNITLRLFDMTDTTAGNAFNWRYSMKVKANGSSWLLNFDDWMYLQDGTHLFNKTEMKKFGVTVGTVTLFFTRKDQ